MASEAGRGSADLDVRVGLPAEHRQAAAELYYEAFFAKLNPILRAPQKGVAILEHDFDAERAIVALRGGRLAGVAGLRHDGRQLAGMRLRSLAAGFGWPRALLKALALEALLARPDRRGELQLDGIVVAPDARGRGIGTRLLEAVFDYARGHGFDRVRLDVVDTNPGARRLYERVGFVAVKTERHPHLMRWFGFSAATTMIKLLPPDNVVGRPWPSQRGK